jgi:hypothetical protein
MKSMRRIEAVNLLEVLIPKIDLPGGFVIFGRLHAIKVVRVVLEGFDGARICYPWHSICIDLSL